MEVELAYGEGRLPVSLPEGNITVVEPTFIPGLADEREAFLEALRNPIGSRPLAELVKPSDRVAIVFSDITRPVPNERILPWLLSEIDFVPQDNIVLINATGMHRLNTPEDFIQMLGRSVVDNYHIINHDSQDKSQLTYLGETRFGGPIWVNSTYLEVDVRILTGFIEPHFFAGFSGGPKSVLPGIAGAESVMANHSFQMLRHPKATWGILAGNPLWEEMLEVAEKAQPTFIANVTTNKKREITGVYGGEMRAAHEKGAAFARKAAMQAVPHTFDIVITTNSGYPLDLNLYQSVKGLSAAAQIVRSGGSIIIASECREGLPEHGNYKRILHMCRGPEHILEVVGAPGFSLFDQWEAQIQAQIQLQAQVYIYSSLPDEEVRAAHLIPCHDIEAQVSELLKRYGPEAAIAVLPEGPQTIPYVAEG